MADPTTADTASTASAGDTGRTASPPRAGRPAGAAGRRLLNRTERRRQLLATGAAAFVASGFAATSIDDVATSAGVTKVILYRHFAGKEELYRAILDEVAEILAAAHAELSAAGTSPSPALESLLVGARRRPDAFRLLTVHAVREADFSGYALTVRRSMEESTAALVAPVVTDPVLAGWLVPFLVDAGIAAVLQWLDHGDPQRDAEFVERTVAGLRELVASVAGGGR